MLPQSSPNVLSIKLLDRIALKFYIASVLIEVKKTKRAEFKIEQELGEEFF
jgi:hypothetical protein